MSQAKKSLLGTKPSERRAQSVHDYFSNSGISSERMRTAGYGETMPVISNLTSKGRKLNRRVEIKIIE